ncbi:hypothetical protein Pmani_032647 [Petrolisthes manimaculis]|uniref:Nicotinamide riboside kinase 1 n=1 Tax=Petrolisthes manimaculis TaxID=1843537 RepID=A0AAE1NRB0_9EUCA|nr:hypothetical protein Pmani_032647 [Petrolisthes manimaculis]
MANQLLNELPKGTRIIKQDDYFYPDDDPHHIPCPGGIQHNNYDVISSMDINKMIQDVKSVIHSSPTTSALTDTLTLGRESELSDTCKKCPMPLPILLLDGFMLYADPQLLEMCDLRYFFTLTRDECWERRQHRSYIPEDPPGYFETCVWPMYEEHLKYVRENVSEVIYLEGCGDHFSDVWNRVLSAAGLSDAMKEKKGNFQSRGYCVCDHSEKEV